MAIFYISIFQPGCYAGSGAKRLLEELFEKSNYNPDLRPVKRENRNVTIHFGAALAEIENLTELGGKLTYRLMLRIVSVYPCTTLNIFCSSESHIGIPM